MKNRSVAIWMVVYVVAVTNMALAATVTVQGIDIDFVSIGNPGNAPDSTGYGTVGYEYRIGKHEVTNAQWNDFVSLSGGAPAGNPSRAYDDSPTYTGAQQPTNGVSWYEALQFCNYLTSGDKSRGAYLFNGDNTNPGDFVGIDRDSAVSEYSIAYLIPTEDEWYKAAYYKPDSSGYSLYANGLNTIPDADSGWNYDGGFYEQPWDVGTGAEEQNGTFDMTGNVWEWSETEVGGSTRVVRGGSFVASGIRLTSSFRGDNYPHGESSTGFRVASVPEPTTLFLLGLGVPIVSGLRRKR